MTPAQLQAWMDRLGYNQTKAANALGISRDTLAVYLAGRRPVPRYIELACVALVMDWR